MTSRITNYFRPFIVFCLVLCLQTVHAQNLAVLPAMPNSASLGKYVDNPVSLYTGKPEIDVPLWEVNMAGGFKLPVSLNYNSGGIKLEEMASSVGLGWSLIGGGVVTRVVRGLPDDYNRSRFVNSNLQIPTGYGRFWHHVFKSDLSGDVLNSFDPSSSDKNYLKEYLKKWEFGPLAGRGVAYDLDPDIFYFNFAGVSGKFVFDVNRGPTEVKTIPFQDVKISYTLNEKSALSSFTIVDDKGNSYLFQDVEENWNLINARDIGSLPSPPRDGFTTTFESGPPSIRESVIIYNSSWYLTTITAANGEKMEFSYENEQINTALSLSSTEVKIGAEDHVPPAYTNMRFGNSLTVSAKRLTGITTKEQRIEFSASLLRGDVYMKNGGPLLPRGSQTSKAITGMKVYSTSSARPLKSYNFQYSYFESPMLSMFVLGTTPHRNTDPDFSSYFKRLKLDKVEEVGQNSDVERSYVFGYKTTHPLPYRFSLEQDLWGYYNGASGNRSPIPKMVIYPDLLGDDRFRVYPKRNYVGRTPLQLNTVRDMISSTEYEAANRLPDSVYMDAGMLTSITYPTGGYTKFTYEPHQFHYDGEDYYGGGLRIRKIDNYALGESQGPATSKRYTYLENGDPKKSSGRAISIPIMGTIWQSTNDLQNNVLRSDVSQSPLGSTAGSSIGYKEVTESMVGLNGDLLGKSVYKYDLRGTHGELNDLDQNGFYKVTQPYMVAIDQESSLESYRPLPGAYPFANSTDYDWNRGSLISKDDHNQNGELISRQKNIYDFYYPYGKSAPGRIYGLTISDFYPTANELIYGDTRRINWYFIFGKYEFLTDIGKVLKSSQSISYNGADSTVKTTNYEYKGFYHVQQTASEFIDSKGDVVKVGYVFPESEFRKPGPDQLIYSRLYGMHITTPVNEKKYHNGKLITELQTKYYEPYPNLIVPYSYRDYVYNGSANNVSIKNIHGYTTKGGIRSFSQNDGVKTTYIWGFGDFYPTAEVLNADSLDVAYTGFSKGEGGGGWSNYNEGYVNDELPNSADGVYDFFGPSPRPLIKKDLTATKNYELSYLSKPDNSIIVTTGNGRIAPVSISGNNEWQLMKYKISNATFVRVEGHGEIDNLRIHPVDAVMTTLTYLPLVGVTSSTDAKGKTVFYEYDSFFRLKNIKDQKGNILKNYEYHFKP